MWCWMITPYSPGLMFWPWAIWSEEASQYSSLSEPSDVFPRGVWFRMCMALYGDFHHISSCGTWAKCLPLLEQDEGSDLKQGLALQTFPLPRIVFILAPSQPQDSLRHERMYLFLGRTWCISRRTTKVSFWAVWVELCHMQPIVSANLVSIAPGGEMAGLCAPPHGVPDNLGLIAWISIPACACLHRDPDRFGFNI